MSASPQQLVPHVSPPIFTRATLNAVPLVRSRRQIIAPLGAIDPEASMRIGPETVPGHVAAAVGGSLYVPLLIGNNWRPVHLPSGQPMSPEEGMARWMEGHVVGTSHDGPLAGGADPAPGAGSWGLEADLSGAWLPEADAVPGWLRSEAALEFWEREHWKWGPEYRAHFIMQAEEKGGVVRCVLPQLEDAIKVVEYGARWVGPLDMPSALSDEPGFLPCVQQIIIYFRFCAVLLHNSHPSYHSALQSWIAEHSANAAPHHTLHPVLYNTRYSWSAPETEDSPPVDIRYQPDDVLGGPGLDPVDPYEITPDGRVLVPPEPGRRWWGADRRWRRSRSGAPQLMIGMTDPPPLHDPLAAPYDPFPAWTLTYTWDDWRDALLALCRWRYAMTFFAASWIPLSSEWQDREIEILRLEGEARERAEEAARRAAEQARRAAALERRRLARESQGQYWG